MSKLFQEHPEARALEDAAWRLKDLGADSHARAMSGPLRSALLRATRDVNRVHDALHAELHKRKRAAGEATGAAEQADEQPHGNGTDAPPAQQELANG